MSSFGPVSAGRSPVFVRPTTGAVSRHSCGLCYCCLASACVLVPDQREVVLHTRLPRGGRLRVCCCGQMALVALPRGAGTFSCPVLSRQPRSRCWFRMSLTILAHGPFGCLELTRKLSEIENNRNRCCLYLSTLVVGSNIVADPQTRRSILARSIATTGPAVASAFPRKWTGEQLPTPDVNEDVLPG